MFGPIPAYLKEILEDLPEGIPEEKAAAAAQAGFSEGQDGKPLRELKDPDLDVIFAKGHVAGQEHRSLTKELFGEDDDGEDEEAEEQLPIRLFLSYKSGFKERTNLPENARWLFNSDNSLTIVWEWEEYRYAETINLDVVEMYQIQTKKDTKLNIEHT
jgi:hypothetical protein